MSMGSHRGRGLGGKLGSRKCGPRVILYKALSSMTAKNGDLYRLLTAAWGGWGVAVLAD